MRLMRGELPSVDQLLQDEPAGRMAGRAAMPNNVAAGIFFRR